MARYITPYRRNLFADFDRMFEELNRLVPTNGDAWFTEDRAFSLDVKEEDNEIFVKAAVPGVKEEDINVKVQGDVLTIEAESRDEFEEQDEDKGWHRKELRYGKFQRSVRLPSEVKIDEADASLEDGMLTIHLPKAKGSTVKQIEVKPKKLIEG